MAMNGMNIYKRPPDPEDAMDAPVIDLMAEIGRGHVALPSAATVETLRQYATEEQVAQLQETRAGLQQRLEALLAGTVPAPMTFVHKGVEPSASDGIMGCVRVLMGDRRGIDGRPSWDEFFLRMAELASTMATCPRAHCGAVIVRHKRALGLGFNGADTGLPHCPSEGEALDEHLALDHCRESVHAEVNALKNAVGNVYGATIYVYGHYAPCINCRGELERVGITDVRHRPGPHYGVAR